MISTRKFGLLMKVVDGAKFNWQTAVKGGRALGAALLRVLNLRVGGMTRGYVGMTFQYAKFVVGLQRHGGWGYVVKYLKACAVLLQQSASGHKIADPRQLGVAVSRTRSGLPRVIHPLSRKAIRSGNPWEVKLWLSYFGLYRVIGMPGKLNLSSITQGPTTTVGFLADWVIWLAKFFPVFTRKVGFSIKAAQWGKYVCRSLVPNGEPVVLSGNLLREFILGLSASVYPEGWSGLPLELKPRFRMFTTSGPGSANPFITSGVPSRTNISSMITDAVLLRHDQVVGPAVQQWLALVGDVWLSELLSTAERIFDIVYNHPKCDPEAPGFFTVRTLSESKGLTTAGGYPTPPSWRAMLGFGNTNGLGKLGFKTEAAGKIRVFAMVDSLTQMLLGPVHDAVFNILKKIPQDGTFEQLRPITLLTKKGYKHFWSYDLSSATDRFPVSLQQAVLGLILGPRLASLWVSILDREFRVPRSIPGLRKGDKPTKVPAGTPSKVRYGAGQPMGALTSWAVFSLTHHFLVQYAAFKAFGQLKWFEAYALLGDDIVISDRKVAEVYLNLLQEIGVGVGLAKSLISSSGGLEFAKRTFAHGQDVSGFPLAAVGAAKADPMVLEDLLQRAGVRGYESALLTAARVLGYGFKTRARLPAVLSTRSRLQGLAILLLRPKSPFGCENFLSWISQGKRGNPAILSSEALEQLREATWQRMWAPLDTKYMRLQEMVRKFLVTPAGPFMMPILESIDRQSLFCSMTGPVYLEFVKKEIYDAYVLDTYGTWEELETIKSELEPLSGREGDINDAYAMLIDFESRVNPLPTKIQLSARMKPSFDSKQRSAAVRLWRASAKLVSHLKDP